jgi:hypothetical protein
MSTRLPPHSRDWTYDDRARAVELICDLVGALNAINASGVYVSPDLLIRAHDALGIERPVAKVTQ